MKKGLPGTIPFSFIMLPPWGAICYKLVLKNIPIDVLSVNFLCHQHDYKTHVTYLYDIVEQKLILMYFARAWRINK